MKTEGLKKHHFWILAGLVPPLIGLTGLLVLVNAGGTAGAEADAIKKRYEAVDKTKPKGTKAIAEWNDQKKVLDTKRQSLWDFNWKLQTGQITRDGKPTDPIPDPNPANKDAYLFKDENLFKWPGSTNQYLREMTKKYQKFGDKMEAPNDEFNIFKQPDVYEAAYNDAARYILPTTFVNGSWRNAALRYVSAWGDARPTDRQIWLALEDYWVQRGLLRPIRDINEDAGRFVLVPPSALGKEPKKKRTFQSRIWRLELEIPETGPNAGKAILAKLTNLTDRLQLLGVGKAMRLEVVLSKNGQPIEYRIEGDFVGANKTLEITTPVPRLHGIPLGTDVDEIVSVRQILDERTVPVRRVDFIAPGFKDARHAPATLKPPSFYPPAEAVDPTMTPGGPVGFGEGGPGGARPSGPGGFPGGQPGGFPGAGPGGVGGQAGRNGTPDMVLDANKDRYLDVTPQVRRLPVAVVILVDQMFVQDALVQYANSPLRFQITQYHWKRFRGTLGNPADPTGASGGFPGTTGGSEEGGGTTLPFSGQGPGSFGPGGRGGPGPVGPGGRGGSGEGGFPPPMAPGGYPGSEGGGMYGPGGTGGASGIAEGQVTSGLVELTIYGIVTLYEKYQDGTEPTATADTGTPPVTELKGNAPVTPVAPGNEGGNPTRPKQ